MAQTYQVSCPPGSKALIAGDTKGGSGTYLVANSHSTEPVYLGGDENEVLTGSGAPLSANTGHRLPAGTAVSIRLDGHEAIYGISGTSTVTCTVTVFRTNTVK